MFSRHRLDLARSDNKGERWCSGGGALGHRCFFRLRGGWLRSQFWISSGCSSGGGDSLLAVLLAVVLGLQSRWQRVLLASLQIGCSSAVPCPVVLASLSRAESGGWASELQVGGVEVDVCGVRELELRQALVRLHRLGAAPLSPTATPCSRWCLRINRW
ncbi:hypothetical protein F2Q69_00011493 [Brassica cretica]|uniref:Uncharacterized protein n=1 Tax=Brassica cretica TaxID=69181 RepID=A0A8S9QUH6_BRACR|nr:hypothetical protein F2Q69_00011493 [Brassica cretica]